MDHKEAALRIVGINVAASQISSLRTKNQKMPNLWTAPLSQNDSIKNRPQRQPGEGYHVLGDKHWEIRIKVFAA